MNLGYKQVASLLQVNRSACYQAATETHVGILQTQQQSR